MGVPLWVRHLPLDSLFLNPQIYRTRTRSMTETEKITAAIQASCIHLMKRIAEPPFRYVCIRCDKKLKIASGVHMENKETTK